MNESWPRIFISLVIVVLCIPVGVESQESASAAKSGSEKRQGEEKASGEGQKADASPSEQPKPEAQPEKQEQPTGHQKSEERTKSEEPSQTPPQVISESRAQTEPGKTEPQPMVLQRPSASHVDTAPPSEDDREAADARIGLGLEIDTIWNTDPGFDLFSEDDVSTQVGVWFSYDLLELTEALILSGEVGLGIGGLENQPLEELDLTWSVNSFKVYLAANLRFSVFSWMHPHVKLAGGASFGTLEFQLRDNGPLRTESEDTTSPLGTIGAGVTFQTPTRMFESGSGSFASLSLGLLVEAGYTVASAMSLSLETNRDEDPIENRTAELGELDLSGPYIRTSVLVRF